MTDFGLSGGSDRAARRSRPRRGAEGAAPSCTTPSATGCGRPRRSAGWSATGGSAGRSGRGFYRYEDGQKAAWTIPCTRCSASGRWQDAEPDLVAAPAGATSMLNEAAQALDEGVVRSPRDGDVGALFGIGFPAFRGGPLRMIDDLTADPRRRSAARLLRTRRPALRARREPGRDGRTRQPLLPLLSGRIRWAAVRRERNSRRLPGARSRSCSTRSVRAPLALLGGASAPVASGLRPPAPPPGHACGAAEFHQFDFWIGTWDVTRPDGARAGENRVEPILGGCVLRESWTGARACTVRATTCTTRPPPLASDLGGRSGQLLVLEGALAGGRIVLEGVLEPTAPAGLSDSGSPGRRPLPAPCASSGRARPTTARLGPWRSTGVT